MNLLIVESPAKAKTLSKYLDSNFTVLSSYGHVRALPSATGSVDPDKEFEMHFEIIEKASENVKKLLGAVKKADYVFLATDPDREGEAISWHLAEIFKQKKALTSKSVLKRVTFNEITKKAVQNAVNNPRDIDMDLVHAQMARQALDYLVGFTLSPVLWRKLPGSKSAGRVQSVALRLIAEREGEIEKFKIEEYWSITGNFLAKQAAIKATLSALDSKKLDKMAITSDQQANAICDHIKDLKYQVTDIEKKRMKRHPSPPFTTSTMIQEASRKFGFSAKRTSQLAQKLYEGVNVDGEMTGLITYMRTDSVNLSLDAVEVIRSTIESLYGKKYLPSQMRLYKTKAKNAQEAHEAIRPTNALLKPQDVKNALDKDQFALYELIWKRTMACQMESAELDITTVEIEDPQKIATFRASGSIVIFDGFYKVYREGIDDAEDEEKVILPMLEIQQALDLLDLVPNQHFTQPPPRFTEASLIKKLEELGIGRPSTYPTIISILQERDYVRIDKKRFIPEVKGRIVSAFLLSYFTKYVEYGFTAALEEELDDVAAGNKSWQKLLHNFWDEFKPKTAEVKTVPNPDIVKQVEKELEYFLYKEEESRACPKCGTGSISLKLGGFGSFIGCSNYPECDFTRNLEVAGDQATLEEQDGSMQFPKHVGEWEDGNEVLIKKGPYGVYLQIGPDKDKRRAAIPTSLWKPEEIDMEAAKFLFSLPKFLGKDSETNEDIKLGIGRFGPYVQQGSIFASVKPSNLVSINLEEALRLIAIKKSKPSKPRRKIYAKKPVAKKKVITKKKAVSKAK